MDHGVEAELREQAVDGVLVPQIQSPLFGTRIRRGVALCTEMMRTSWGRYFYLKTSASQRRGYGK